MKSEKSGLPSSSSCFKTGISCLRVIEPAINPAFFKAPNKAP